jgi:hypothetical protein
MLTIPVLDLNFHVLFLLMAAPGAPSALAWWGFSHTGPTSQDAKPRVQPWVYPLNLLYKRGD